MMLRVDHHAPDDAPAARCEQCGSVSGLTWDGRQFRCRDECPPEPTLLTFAVDTFGRSWSTT